MALSPRSLFVYVVVYLIFNPVIISSEILSGQPPKLDFLTPWLPEEESPKLDLEQFALLKFDDRVINKLDESEMKELVQCIGNPRESYLGYQITKIFKKTLTNIFMKVISTENGIRRDQSLNLINVYIPISVKLVHDRGSLQETQFLEVDLIKYLIEEGSISGFIFEASLLLIPIPLCISCNPDFHASLHPTVKKIKMNMIALEHRFGYKLELGLAVNSLQECGSLLVGNFSQTVMLFDMVAYSHEEMDTCKSYNGVNECMKLFRDKFLGIKCHAVEQVIAIKI